MTNVRFEGDFGPAGWAIGSMNGIAAEIEAGAYVQEMVTLVTADAQKEIGRQIDLLANTDGNNLGHVYEFKKSGKVNPIDRLFRITRSGRGRSREISFKFLPSSRGGPSLRERINRGELDIDTSNRVFTKGNGRVQLNKKYIFRNKAAVLEAGTVVNIRPKTGKKIFIPFARGTTPAGGEPFAFVSGAEVNLGATRHTGQFSAAWKIATAAAAVRGAEKAEKDFALRTKSVRFRSGRSRRKSFNVTFAEATAKAKAEFQRMDTRQ